MSKKEIDFSRTIDTDDIDMALDPLKGVAVLLQALELTHEAGHHEYDKYAYLALCNVCHDVIKELEGIKPMLDYMNTKMREGR